MENWELDFHWLKVKHYIRDTFKNSSMPDLESILFLIGVQEHGKVKKTFSKDKKMKLMHNGAACLLSQKGYFKLDGRDGKGWQIWSEDKKMDLEEKEKNALLKEMIISYFEAIIPEDYESEFQE